MQLEACRRAVAGREQLTQAVHQAFGEAREWSQAIATPAQLHEFVERFVGPMKVKENGRVLSEKKKTSAPP